MQTVLSTTQKKEMGDYKRLLVVDLHSLKRGRSLLNNDISHQKKAKLIIKHIEKHAECRKVVIIQLLTCYLPTFHRPL